MTVVEYEKWVLWWAWGLGDTMYNVGTWVELDPELRMEIQRTSKRHYPKSSPDPKVKK